MLRKYFLPLLIVLALLLPVTVGWAVEDERTVRDLTKAYEVWKHKGIKFVIRDEQGHFKSWGIGKLESWGGESKWVVRDPKGHFLVHARGRVENWSNGKTKLVLRDPKGHLMTHLPIDLTSKGSFAQNVVGLRRLKDDRFLAFVQETLTELLMKELKTGDTIRTRVLVQYLKQYKTQPGVDHFRPVLREVIRSLNFMAGQHPDDKIDQLLADAKAIYAVL